jgi:hypothetical protein
MPVALAQSETQWEAPAEWLEALQFVEEAGARARAILLEHRTEIIADRRLRAALASLDDALDELEGENVHFVGRAIDAASLSRRRWGPASAKLDRLEAAGKALLELAVAEQFPEQLSALLADMSAQSAWLRERIRESGLLEEGEPGEPAERFERRLPISIDRSLRTLAARACPYDYATRTDVYESALRAARLARLEGGFDAYASAVRALPEDVQAGVELAAATASLNWFGRLVLRRQLKKVMREAYLEGELSALSKLSA